jgi:hypothetical protein
MHPSNSTHTRNGALDAILATVLLAVVVVGGGNVISTQQVQAPTHVQAQPPNDQPDNVGDACWVTGDMVGDLNPAVVHIGFCATQ